MDFKANKRETTFETKSTAIFSALVGEMINIDRFAKGLDEIVADDNIDAVTLLVGWTQRQKRCHHHHWVCWHRMSFYLLLWYQFSKNWWLFFPYHSFSTTMSNQFCVWLCRLFVSQHLLRENSNSMALNVLTSNSLISQMSFHTASKTTRATLRIQFFVIICDEPPSFLKAALCGSVLPTLIGTFLLPKDHAKMRLLFACQENCHDNLIPMV